MAKRKILSVNFTLLGDEAEEISHDSGRSLLDGDIIIYEPLVGYYTTHKYQGKPSFGEFDSFKIREEALHWHQQLLIASEAGKTIFVFLNKPYDCFIDSGQRQYSGTGKNRQTTRLVDSFTSYSILPLASYTRASGQEIKPAKDLKFLATYWKEFAKYSSYEVYIEDNSVESLLMTIAGSKCVGGVINKNKGSIVLLPALDFPIKDAPTLEKKLATVLAEIDKALKNSHNKTPMPSWVDIPNYKVSSETLIISQINEIIEHIQSFEKKKNQLTQALDKEANLRSLLYETGKPLELAILETLTLLGFKAEPYDDGKSEFDAVFVSLEGRFLGEAEGKENKAVNIDKIRQLETNIQEDFARDEITEHAKGVLFGNAFRLSPLDERGEFFSDKCLASANRSGIALVKTPDLFFIAKYLKEHDDKDFAAACRQAIKDAQGVVVQFPPIPQQPDEEILFEQKAIES